MEKLGSGGWIVIVVYMRAFLEKKIQKIQVAIKSKSNIGTVHREHNNTGSVHMDNNKNGTVHREHNNTCNVQK